MSHAFRRAWHSPARGKPLSVVAGLEVRLSSIAPATLLAEVRGELDMATAPDLYARVADAFAPEAHELVVVDLGQVGFCAAAGINALLRIHAHAHEHDAAVRFVAAAGPVRRLLRMVDLVAALDVHSTRAGALATGSAAESDPSDSFGLSKPSGW